MILGLARVFEFLAERKLLSAHKAFYQKFPKEGPGSAQDLRDFLLTLGSDEDRMEFFYSYEVGGITPFQHIISFLTPEHIRYMRVFLGDDYKELLENEIRDPVIFSDLPTLSDCLNEVLAQHNEAEKKANLESLIELAMLTGKFGAIPILRKDIEAVSAGAYLDVFKTTLLPTAICLDGGIKEEDGSIGDIINALLEGVPSEDIATELCEADLLTDFLLYNSTPFNQALAARLKPENWISMMSKPGEWETIFQFDEAPSILGVILEKLDPGQIVSLAEARDRALINEMLAAQNPELYEALFFFLDGDEGAKEKIEGLITSAAQEQKDNGNRYVLVPLFNCAGRGTKNCSQVITIESTVPHNPNFSGHCGIA